MSAINVGAAIYIALKPILKIYTIILVGFLIAKFNIVTMETARGISNMVVNAILPCLTFNKIVASISWRDIKEIGVIVLSAIILFVLGGVFSLFAKFTTPVPKKWFWGIMFAGIFPNISDLPIAYLQSMGNGTIFTADEANKGVAYCCIFLFTQSFLMMNFGMWRMVGLDFRERGKKDDEHIDLEEGSSLDEKEQGNGKNVSTSDISQNESLKNTQVPLNEPANLDGSDLDSGYPLSDLNSDQLSDDDENPSIDYVRQYDDKRSIDSMSERILPLKNAHLRRETEGSSAYRISSITSSPSVLQTIGIREELNKSRHSRTRRMSTLRKRRPTMNEVIAEYSVVDKLKNGELDLTRPLSLIEDIGDTNASLGGSNIHNESDEEDDRAKVVTTSHEDDTKLTFKEKMSDFIKRHKLGWLTYIIVNCFRPASLGALLGIICALVPWLKALFVATYVHVHMAPDHEPVLNFLMDFTEYIGNACVPLGLLMLGGTLARLEITALPKGFIRSAILMTVGRLVIIPIIGILWANKLALYH